ncbi:MAG TPA: SMC-Scp complex subunit ScpB [Bacillales bacterium]|nr:SMC-Scp complex subunit ScpB [Bacillales bacterium]
MERKSIIEGLLFLAGDNGLEPKQIAGVLDVDGETVKTLMEQLKVSYESEEHGIQLVEVAETYKFMTKPEIAPYIQRLIDSPNKSTLSQAAMETLAIVAYKQPITRTEIEDIRGVKTERALQTLVSHALIKEVGRAEGAGRAILYGTTDEFLEYFGLRSLKELPPFPEELEGQLHFEEIELFDRGGDRE